MLRFAIAATSLLTAAPAPAQTAQQPSRERYVQIAEGERCPRSTDEEVVVCGVVREDERYRIPDRLREPARIDAVTNTERVLEVIQASDIGTMSCSNVGPGGFTGCYMDLAAQWREARDRARQESERAVRR